MSGPITTDPETDWFTRGLQRFCERLTKDQAPLDADMTAIWDANAAKLYEP